MTFEIAINALGGLALFLLAMLLMTEGLTVFAGEGLKKLLARGTATPLRGVFSGILITGLVQSSSAVTVATIGFVNAGVLTLRQALGVIYGTNVGTTVTGWLVSLVGFGFRIEAFAMPILILGVALRLLSVTKRGKGLGMALAGFGLFFLGLTILKGSFQGLAAAYEAQVLNGYVLSGKWTFLLVGFVATILAQSSSAAIAIVLTAAAGGLVGIENAAAAVIGANLGTTSTALVAVIKATPNAKRLATAHILFNSLTGVVALALLPGLLWLVENLGEALKIEGSPAAVLALFHSAFNILGVFLLLPATLHLERLLGLMFRSAEEDMSRPRHLDSTLAATPALAVSALRHELMRLRGMVTAMMQASLSGTVPREDLEAQADAAHALAEAISSFAATVRTEVMSRAVSEELAHALSMARYLQEAARLSPHILRLRQRTWRLPATDERGSLEEVMGTAGTCMALAAADDGDTDADRERTVALERFADTYHRTKKNLLDGAVAGSLTVQVTERLLDHLSLARRAVEQLVKGDRLLRSPSQAREIDAEHEEAGNDRNAGASAESTASELPPPVQDRETAS